MQLLLVVVDSTPAFLFRDSEALTRLEQLQDLGIEKEGEMSFLNGTSEDGLFSFEGEEVEYYWLTPNDKGEIV